MPIQPAKGNRRRVNGRRYDRNHWRPNLKSLAAARVAFVHDWLTGFRGGEKCLEVLCREFPDAPIYTLLHVPGSLPSSIEEHRIYPSFLQRLPRIGEFYRYTLPVMPFAANWPIRPCDLVLSFSHAFAKSAQPPSGIPHVCYCFTPMRYAWHMKESYFADRAKGLKAQIVDKLMSALRTWDRRTANRVTHFIAISQTIQKRIQDCYNRSSVIIYPPVDTDFYHPDPQILREDFYLVLSAFAPYKRVDLAIEACNQLRKRLVIIGSGQDAARLKALAGPTVSFLGWKPDGVLRDHLRRCRALIFPGEEDFGIVPVEANACGAPVLAFARGGATETIVPLKGELSTGEWFEEQTVESLIAAMERLERAQLDPANARIQSSRFAKEIYRRSMLDYMESVLRG